MNTSSYAGQPKINRHEFQKTNQFTRSNTNKQKRQKQTIIFLLQQERMFDYQNNREMINNSRFSKDRKQSSQKIKLNHTIKQSLYEKLITLTPKFKKHVLSQSKLPPIKKRDKKQLKQAIETIAPWEQQESNDLMRPHSSKFLPY